MIKGIIFDMDGTLTDTNYFHNQAIAQVLADFGLKLTLEERQSSIVGRSSMTIFKEKLAGLDFDINECMMRKSRYLKEIVDQAGKVQLIPGILPFLTWAKEQGILLAVATGSDRTSMHAILENAGIKPYFQYLYSSLECANSKPAPDVYLAASEALGFEKSEILTFEDSISGVKSAKAAGLFCVGLLTSTEKNLLISAGVDKIVNDYRDLMKEIAENPDYLNQINI